MRAISWPLWGLLIAAIVVPAIWFTVSEYSVPEEQRTVRVAVSRTPLSTPIYIADALGFFDDVGLKVELVEVIGGGRSFERVMSGQAEFGASSDSVIVFKGLIRNDFVNLATFVQSDNDVKIIAAEDNGIRDAADLRGKKVAVTKGSASEYFLTLWLGVSGVDASQVQMINSNPEDMGKALENGEVDAIVPWEPYGYEVVRQFAGKAKVFQTKGLYPLTFNLIARKDYAQNNSEVSRRFLKALDMAIEHISLAPHEAQQTMRKRLRLDQDFIRWVWTDYLFKLSLGRSLLLTLESQARWALQSGQFAGMPSPDFSTMIDVRPLSAVKPTAVTLYR